MPKERSFIYGLLFGNKLQKLLALLLAIIAWVAIWQTISFESVINDVPLRIKVDEGWAVLNRSIDAVDVQFRGAQDDLLSLERDRLEVTVDVRGQAIEGSTALELTPNMIKVPGGIRVTSLRPDTVRLSLDKESEKQITVKADIRGELPEGYEIEHITCTPDSVSLRGPSPRVAETEVIRTTPIDMEGRPGSFRVRCAVIPPSDTWVAKLEPEKVTVEINIVERSGEKVIKNIPVDAILSPEDVHVVKIVPNEIEVTLTGRIEALDKLQAENITVYVDCKKLKDDSRYTLPVKVHAPDDFEVKKIEPATVAISTGKI